MADKQKEECTKVFVESKDIIKLKLIMNSALVT